MISDRSHNCQHRWLFVFKRQVGSCVFSQNMQGHGKEQAGQVAMLGTPGSWATFDGEYQLSEHPALGAVCRSMLWWSDAALGPELRRASIWPCDPGERKEGLAAHQDSPNGPFPNYRVSIQMLGSQEEIQTKRKMYVLYCWIQEY